MLPVHQRLIHWLEERGDLDRAIEFLPSDSDIARRHDEQLGLTSPEFSVLVAYAKIVLKRDLLATDLPDDPWFERTLRDYFPPQLVERYGDRLDGHPLRREIVINSVVNSMVNRGGITFVFRAEDETGATAEQVARAYLICPRGVRAAGVRRRGRGAGQPGADGGADRSSTWSSGGCSTARSAGSSRTGRPRSTSPPRSSASATRCGPLQPQLPELLRRGRAPAAASAGPRSWSRSALRRSWRTGRPRCSTPSRCSTSPRSRPRPACRRARWRRSTSRCPSGTASTPCSAGSPRCRARTAGTRWPGPRCGSTSTPPWSRSPSPSSG